ncbi:hypothetical protein HMPREF0262_00672 [Clostridium sp. ATCC 29733]|nr:hypothetical protein HMPREF0262_00672 [Clostridium sp. ATCC 29733]
MRALFFFERGGRERGGFGPPGNLHNLCVEFSPFLSFRMCYNGQNGPSTARKEEFV